MDAKVEIMQEFGIWEWKFYRCLNAIYLPIIGFLVMKNECKAVNKCRAVYFCNNGL